MFVDVSIQSSVAYAIHAMSQYSPDTAKNITVDLAPLVFLAMHGTVNEDGIIQHVHVCMCIKIIITIILLTVILLL